MISYHDVANRVLEVLACTSVSCSDTQAPTVPDSAGEVGVYTSLELATGDLPVVAPYDATNGDLRILRCADTGCAAGRTVVGAGTGDVGIDASLALDGGGNAVVAYFDATNGDLAVLRCHDPGVAGLLVRHHRSRAGAVDSQGRTWGWVWPVPRRSVAPLAVT